MADFGYDVADYCDVDPIFGRLADLDELIEKAHAVNIRVIVDLVPNHTSDQHEWFCQSKQSRESELGESRG
jgi:alpha-glucosidase